MFSSVDQSVVMKINCITSNVSGYDDDDDYDDYNNTSYTG